MSPRSESPSWAVQLAAADAVSLARLRGRSLRVCEAGGSIWLIGTDRDDELRNELLTLPAAARFAVMPDRQLVADGCLVPSGYLPDGTWSSLDEFIRIRLSVASLAGQAQDLVTWKLVRSRFFAEPNVLLISLSAWHEYGITAPQVRLDRWRFAANDVGNVLVWGEPLPPVPGERYVEVQGVAIPAGWELSPRIDPNIVRQVVSAGSDDFVLLHLDGTHSVIGGTEFVKARRSAVRETGRRIFDF